MSRFWTKTTESAKKRELLAHPQQGGRETRAESMRMEPLLEYQPSTGVNRKWCGSYFGGETTAG